MSPPSLSLQPGPIPRTQYVSWAKSGRTIKHALCPGASQVALYSTPDLKDLDLTVPPQAAKDASSFQGDRAVFLARWDGVPAHLVPLYSKTFTIFQSLQQIADQTKSEGSGFGAPQSPPTSSQISFYSRVCSLYIDTIRQHLLPASDDSSDLSSFPPADIDHWSLIFSTMHLARILYMPEDGRGEGVVGEELLDWLNLADCGPTEEEGAEILDGGEEAWRHPEFWSYLIRSLLRGFLNSASQLLLTLTSHPCSQLAALAPRVASHLLTYPRSSSSSFTSERAFLQAHAQWRASLRVLTRPLTSGWARASWSAGADEDEAELQAEGQALEESVGSLIQLLIGQEERVLEESVDWKEALGAWGVWVRPNQRRDDLPSIIERITNVLPLATDPIKKGTSGVDGNDSDRSAADETVEIIQTSLLLGDTTLAVTTSNDFSLWLATHLTDILTHLTLLPLTSSRHGGRPQRTLRDHYILEYAGHLASDGELWTLACEYAGRVSGPEGKMTVAALLATVSLDKTPDEGVVASDREEEEPEVDQEKVEDVLRILHSHGLEEESRTLSRAVAERLIREKQYGLAVAFSVRAGDSRKLDGIADQVLDTYVRHGSEAFITHVESIPTSLLDPTTSAGATSYLSSALSFLPLYHQFLVSYQQDLKDVAAGLLVNSFRNGLAPKSFWSVLMVDLVPLLEDAAMLVPTDDAYLLLKHLEDLLTSSIDQPFAYLSHLRNLRAASTDADKPTADSEEASWKDVRKSLDVVRLALARYLARDLAMS